MAGPPVPNRPELEDEDYQLGGPGWMDQFAQNTSTARGGAAGLNVHGKTLSTQALDAQNRAGIETNFGRSQAFGGQQTRAADWMTDFAQGPQGPSAAQSQLQQGANRAMGQSLALARSGSGFGESANAMADAQRANADIATDAAIGSAQLRAQEDQAFRGQQLQAMGGAADIYGGAAAREGGQAQFGTESDLQAQQMRDAMQLGLGGQSIEAQNLGIQGQLAAQGVDLDAQNAALQGRIAQGQTEAQLYGTEADVFATREARDRALHEQRRADRGEVAATVGGIAGAAASIFSDERGKHKVRGAQLRSRYAALKD
jgi:hypothetical protein